MSSLSRAVERPALLIVMGVAILSSQAPKATGDSEAGPVALRMADKGILDSGASPTSRDTASALIPDWR